VAEGARGAGGADPPGHGLRVVFLAHAFPRRADDVTGGFLLRLATALRAEGV